MENYEEKKPENNGEETGNGEFGAESGQSDPTPKSLESEQLEPTPESSESERSEPNRETPGYDPWTNDEKNFEFKPVRYHHPTEKISRGFGEKMVIWSVQVFLTVFLYYYSTLYDLPLMGTTRSILSWLDQETLMFFFDIRLFVIFAVLAYLSKLFYRGSVFCGVLLGEWFVQGYLQPSLPFNWEITAIPLFFAALFMFTPYKGGEYQEPRALLRDFYLLLGTHFVLLVYVFLVFDHPYITTIGGLLFAGSFIPHFVLIPVGFYALDSFLKRYFPLTEEEQAALDQYDAEHPEDPWNDYLMPEPGELYLLNFTHHSIDEDDHTIRFLIGDKVRLYLCTRCSGMIVGVMFALLFESVSRNVFGFTLPDAFYLYFNVAIPAIALLDWGTQKVALRKSSTRSRLFTGATVGIAMNNMTQVPHQYMFHLINALVYFCIFFLLFFFGEKRPGKPRIFNREKD